MQTTSRTRFYRTWVNMKHRCGRDKGYENVKLHEDWKLFQGFKKDMYESYLEHAAIHGEKDTSIDRIDVNGDYCKENCRWATARIQQNNKRNNITYNGETAAEASHRITNGKNRYLVKTRIKCGWSLEKAFTTPLSS